MKTRLGQLPQHPVRSLVPVLEIMSELGFGTQVCLKGTGILLSQLENPEARMSMQQQLGFYRNALRLSDDPLIGLKLGEPFIPQRYGLFGYAMLSAATFRHTLSLAVNFGRLTFSFSTFSFTASGEKAWFSMSNPPPFEEGLLQVYQDRDVSAAVVAFREVLGRNFPLSEIHLAHDGQGHEQRYQDYFDCPVFFSSSPSKLVFPSSLLDKPLPQSDPDSSRHLAQQCQMLIAKLSSQGHFIDDVRMLILARPGYFPDIDYVSEKLGMSIRTLRRRLKEEKSSYREQLDEVRYGLAREYLGETRLPLEEISELLGYTEAGNFSHAFRRWSGQSPSDWRKHRD